MSVSQANAPAGLLGCVHSVSGVQRGGRNVHGSLKLRLGIDVLLVCYLDVTCMLNCLG